MTILFPSRCFICTKKEETLCQECLSRCRRALETPYPFILSLYDFKETTIRRAVHAIKYYHRKDIVSPLAHTLVQALKQDERYMTADDWTLVPVPMPRFRRMLRGYNQAEIIAKALASELFLPVRTDILKRSRAPMRQVKACSKNERIRNQKGSFTVQKSPIGMNIILVDDVTTTGATLSEARTTLLKEGSGRVLAITIAH